MGKDKSVSRRKFMKAVAAVAIGVPSVFLAPLKKRRKCRREWILLSELPPGLAKRLRDDGYVTIRGGVEVTRSVSFDL